MPTTSLFSGIPNDFPPLKTDAWSLIFPAEMGISERFQVKASRPHVTNDVKEVMYKGGTFKFKGKTKVENMEIEFRDVVGPAVMQKLWQWQREHYDFVSGCGGYAAQYKKNLILLMEDDCGNPVQKWILQGCFIAKLDGGSLDMDTADIVKVSITIAYDIPVLVY